MSSKRSRSLSSEDVKDTIELSKCARKEASNNDNLLTELTQVLDTIRSIPSSGEISAEVMETFKVLMLEIDGLPADESNADAKRVKYESEQCLESWFDDLLAKCQAEGVLNLEDIEGFCESDNEEDLIRIAMTRKDEDEDKEKEAEEEDELIIVDDDEIASSSQVVAV
ncbi:hypothetical protein INT46_010313 [Mucor plumbeus]|uniref:Uncharacterized protein n=1 Tax=Mucor plumbeus TaxID=97098 RepID=A0A8H7RGC6_9FUNG|nr:hypothetical protein INT46_010313 [Mucor plumbeus]